MSDAGIVVHDARVRRALSELRRHSPDELADALNRVGFEILDDEERAIRSAFSFVSASTASFLARAFRFDKATASNLVLTVRSKPRQTGLLVDHVRGGTIRAGPERLSVEGKLAVPIRSNVKRTARGKVPSRLSPQVVLAPGGKGFINRAGTAILQRFGPARQRRVRILYALISSAQLEQRFDHVRVAVATVHREFPRKAKRAIEKAVARARSRA